MKKNLIQNIIFILALVLYHIFFWKQSLGVNVLLFTVLMIAALFYIHEDSRQSSAARLTAIGTLITAICVVVFNSTFSKVIHILSFTSMVGFVQQRELRFLWYGLLMAVHSMLFAPISAFRQILKNVPNPQWINQSWRYARISVLPMFVVFIFFGLYSFSNSQFGLVVGNTTDAISEFIDYSLRNFTFGYFLFTLFSLLIIGGLFLKNNWQWLTQQQGKHQETIERKRKSKPFKSASILGLKNEYRSALILLFTLNALTFLVNLTDLQHTWIGFAALDPYSISMDVHFGTYVLIATIIIAISLLMFYFRRNLNFYKKNKWLKIAAYSWIGQNIFLALSVALRNIKYVEYYGLTYKRIGVFIFLGLVIYGLTTVIKKISKRKTAYFLFQHNASAFYLVMVMLSAFNWDVWMTDYNLNISSNGNVDTNYLIKNISDKNLPQLIAYQQSDKAITYQKRNIDFKKQAFLQKTKHQSWLEWNYADHQTTLYLRKHHLAD